MDWIAYWQALFTTQDGGVDLIDGLLQDGYLVIDSALPTHLYLSLVNESLDSVGYDAAKIGVGGRAESIRSDTTRWLDKDASVNHSGALYLMALEGLGQFLNQSLYIGVRSVEAHYACYQPGQFYAQHCDNLQGADVRAMSTVMYLNGTVGTDWPQHWGGALRVVDHHEMQHDVLPCANRLVIFHSDLLHEVLPATHVRRSIAGWLRRDGVV